MACGLVVTEFVKKNLEKKIGIHLPCTWVQKNFAVLKLLLFVVLWNNYFDLQIPVTC